MTEMMTRMPPAICTGSITSPSRAKAKPVAITGSSVAAMLAELAERYFKPLVYKPNPATVERTTSAITHSHALSGLANISSIARGCITRSVAVAKPKA